MPDLIYTASLYIEYAYHTQPLLFLLGLALAVSLYFLPLIVAGIRNMPNAVAIGVLNLVAGWTFVGWVVALVWACTERRR